MNPKRILDSILEFSVEIQSMPIWRKLQSSGASGRCALYYMQAVHRLISKTPDHLHQAIGRARADGRMKLVAHFVDKLDEETGHERWSARDLIHLVGKFGKLTLPGSPAVDELFSTIESAITRNPASYLAYMLLAEHLTVLLGKPMVDALGRGHGLGRSAFTAIVRHVELDAAHTHEGYEAVRTLCAETDSADLEALLSASMGSYRRFLGEMTEVAAS